MKLRLAAALLTLPLASGAFGQVPVTDQENLKERATDAAQSTQTKRTQDDSKKQTERTACNVMNKDFTRRLGMNAKEVVKEEPENAALIRAYAKAYGVSERLALSVAYAESRLSSCAGSHTGVRGVMQLTQRTGKGLGGFDRDINEQNIEGGVKLLSQAVAKCGEDDFECLARIYNGSNAQEQRVWANTARRAYGQLTPGLESDYPLPGPTYASPNTGGMPASSPVKAALDQSSSATRDTANRVAAFARTGPSNLSALKATGDGAGEQERFQSAWDENTQARVQVGQLWNQAIDTQTMANMLIVTRLVDQITRLSQVANAIAYDPRAANPFTSDCGLLALQGRSGAGCVTPGPSRIAAAATRTADGGFVSLPPLADAASVRDRLRQLQTAANARDAASGFAPAQAAAQNDQVRAALAALAMAAGRN